MRIIHESAGVIAVWKPAGIATQAPPGIASAEAWLRQRLHGGDPRGYVGVPHRLDRGVSGVVLFAATPRAARKLSRQFERRQVRKTYLAIVAARPEAATHVDDLECGAAETAVAADFPEGCGPAGTRWHDFLVKVPDEPRARIAAAGEPQAREAVTFARLVRRLAQDRLLLELMPVTGRMHQLRLQAATRGIPMLGDGLYGGPGGPWVEGTFEGEAPAAAGPGNERIALHAVRIAYADPDSGDEVVVEAPLPDWWPLTAR